MEVVAFGVLPGERLGASPAPMAEVAAVYLPVGAASFVTFGAIMALTTSMNSTMLVPSRLGIILAGDRLAPEWLGAINPKTGTPILGLTLTMAASAFLLVTGQVSLALNVAVFALVILYGLHSLVFLILRRRNPSLYGQISVAIPKRIQWASGAISFAAMAGLVLVQVYQDVGTLRSTTFKHRVAGHSLTSVELLVAWGAVGAVLYLYGRWRTNRSSLTGPVEG
jgi:amino acid efflux transporter